MFKWLRKEVIVRDEMAQKVCDMLFPEPQEREQDGYKFLIDYSVDGNLHSALVDLEDGENDETTRETIRSALHQLEEARRLLYANYKVKGDARYLLVDSPENRKVKD